MNPLEQKICDAAPIVRPATFPADAATAMMSGGPDGVETLGPGGLTARRRGPWRRLVRAALAVAIFAAGGMWATAALTTEADQEHGNSGEAGPPTASAGIGVAGTTTPVPAAASLKWRTATVLTPWADTSSSVEASIELPSTWSVQRHEASAEYPGLHVTVVDETSLPVVVLYFGPSASNESCPLPSGPELQLQRAEVITGAELLDPALAAAFSYGLSTGPEPRGSFGLVPRSSEKNACGAFIRTPGESPVVLRFGDVLGFDARGHTASAPRSSYARTFSSPEEARRYLQSQEFSTLKRLVTSLKFSFPEDRSKLWQVPDHRRSGAM